MKAFDLHCDTIGECSKRALSLYKNSLHFDLERASGIGEYIQVFAIWIPDEIKGQTALEYFDKVADCFYKELDANREFISLYEEDRKTPVKAILAVEGGSGAGGTLDGLNHLYSRGVRLITLTWNGQNEIASGAYSEGGLTQFGRRYVKECENKNIIIDASHLNRQSFFELAQVVEKPFLASHSNADIVNSAQGKKRNLSKEEIEVIKNKGGIIGLNYFTEFLEDENAKGLEALCRQIDYLFEMGCENIIALGSDYDGCDICSELSGVEKLPEIYNKLLLNGYSEKTLNNLFYYNAHSFFERVYKKNSIE